MKKFTKYHFELACRMHKSSGLVTTHTVCGSIVADTNERAISLCKNIAKERKMSLSLVYQMSPKPFTEIYIDN